MKDWLKNITYFGRVAGRAVGGKFKLSRSPTTFPLVAISPKWLGGNAVICVDLAFCSGINNKNMITNFTNFRKNM